MSIVEAAVQMADKEAGLSIGSESSVSIATVVQPSPPHSPESPPIPPGAARQVDDLSPTRRDLKTVLEIPIERLRSEGRLPPAEHAHRAQQELRRIKWPLLNAIKGRGVAAPTRNNVILVTSALPGEGKSFTSLSLALSIVRDPEMRAILVDGDVARPGLTPALGLSDRAGLTDVFDDPNLDVGAVTYVTDIPGLFFVPAGRWREQSPEYFAGRRMPQVIAALSQRVGNGVVIVDSPPLLATNEAQVVTRHVGQVLFVVRADHTEQRAVLDALALVDKSTPISAVLNQVEPSTVGRYYGRYDYGYGQSNLYGGGQDTGKGRE